MSVRSLYRTYRRYRTLQTDVITSLPIAILMPHSACNCRCVMCDIWKGNKNLKQLTIADISGLLATLRQLDTQQVLFSGGEALLNPGFFDFCRLLKQEGLNISLLSTGLTLSHHARDLVQWVDEIIVSLDGSPLLHDSIRNLPGAFKKLQEGIRQIRTISPEYPVSGRCVIHRLNFRDWPAIVETALRIRLDHISFLPADVSSQAFNRDIPWTADRQSDVVPLRSELQELQDVLDSLLLDQAPAINSGFISENANKLQKIVDHYKAFHGLCPYPYKRCNAPWVSTVVEADGTVRPCFFHAATGNIHEQPLLEILNSPAAVRFRKELNLRSNPTCQQCVCYLHLSPGTKLVRHR